VDERLNENRYPLHSVLREIQETDCGDLADLTPLVAVAGQLKFQGRAQRQGPLGEADVTPSQRFGIGMNKDHTLEEVGQQFSVTRERIRQIEAKALRKLKHPSRSRVLRSFLDN